MSYTEMSLLVSRLGTLTISVGLLFEMIFLKSRKRWTKENSDSAENTIIFLNLSSTSKNKKIMGVNAKLRKTTQKERRGQFLVFLLAVYSLKEKCIAWTARFPHPAICWGRLLWALGDSIPAELGLQDCAWRSGFKVDIPLDAMGAYIIGRYWK